MENGLLHLHNFLRWVVLLTGVWALIRAAGGLSGRKAFTAADKRAGMFFMISCDVQLLLGLTLYFLRPWASVLGNQGMAVMRDSVTRFWAIEHISGMLIAIVLVHIGYAAAKSDRPDAARFRRWFWFTLIAILVMLATIPWPGRGPGIERGLFPGMGA